MIKILIVDNNKENLYLLETMLKGSGYDVVSATNGTEALKKLRAENFDMIISDILMPVMDGFQLCQKVKGDAKLNAIPFVSYTATYLDEKDEYLALKLGADRFIRKPIEADEFIRIIQGVIEYPKKGKIIRRKRVVKNEKEVLKLYNERLVNKLEKKMLDLEREVTEHKEAEAALRKSEQKYRQFIETAQEGIWAIDKDANTTFVNDRMAKMLGYTADEMLGKHLFSFMEKRGMEIATINLERRKQGIREQHDFEFLRKDGMHIYTLVETSLPASRQRII